MSIEKLRNKNVDIEKITIKLNNNKEFTLLGHYNENIIDETYEQLFNNLDAIAFQHPSAEKARHLFKNKEILYQTVTRFILKDEPSIELDIFKTTGTVEILLEFDNLESYKDIIYIKFANINELLSIHDVVNIISMSYEPNLFFAIKRYFFEHSTIEISSDRNAVDIILR